MVRASSPASKVGPTMASSFGATARDEVELEKLTRELLNVVGETMQPTLVTLWLKSTDDRLLKQEMENEWTLLSSVGDRAA
jgi:hypothetical protein